MTDNLKKHAAFLREIFKPTIKEYFPDGAFTIIDKDSCILKIHPLSDHSDREVYTVHSAIVEVEGTGYWFEVYFFIKDNQISEARIYRNNYYRTGEDKEYQYFDSYEIKDGKLIAKGKKYFIYDKDKAKYFNSLTLEEKLEIGANNDDY